MRFIATFVQQKYFSEDLFCPDIDFVIDNILTEFSLNSLMTKYNFSLREALSCVNDQSEKICLLEKINYEL